MKTMFSPKVSGAMPRALALTALSLCILGVGSQKAAAQAAAPELTSATSTAGSTSVTLTWTESDTNAGWYRVRYGTSSGNYTAQADFAGSRGTITGLTTGTRYFFAVFFYESGNSVNPTPFGPSNELSAQAGVTASPTPAPGLTPPRQASAAGFNTLDFDEEFTGPLDIGYGTTGHKWNAGLWWETIPPASAFHVNNHVLTITATATNNVNLCTQYHDASGGTSFQGGYFEARILATDWSAFWLFCWDRPRVWGNLVLPGNPMTWTNEIDIIETDASTPSTAVTTLHSNTSSDGGVPDQQNANNNNPMPSGQTVAQWHTYGVLWTQTAVTWYVDNVQVCTVAPYASTWQPTQLILSAQPGGVNGGKSNVQPPITQVRWVHVWK